jgi:hypothetical protein
VILVLILPTVVVVLVMLAAGQRETKIGPLRDAPGPGRRDRRPVAPVVEIPSSVPVELVETRVEIRRAAHA